MPNIIELFDLCKKTQLTLKVLEESGDININDQDDHGNNLVHLACQFQPENFEVLHFLVLNQINTQAINHSCQSPLQLLMDSQLTDQEIVVRGTLLLDYGANANDTDKFGVTFHRIKQVIESVNSIDLELDNYIKPNFFKKDVFKLCWEKTLTFTELKENWYPEIINKHRRRGFFHGALLHFLCHYKPTEYLQLIQYFLQKNPQNINQVTTRSPAFYACFYGTTTTAELLQLLIQNGANVNSNDNLWCNDNLNYQVESTPLHQYLQSGGCSNKEGFRWLIKNGADINIQDSAQNLPLHNLAINSNTDVNLVKILIENTQDLTVKNINNKMPLHYLLGRRDIVLFYLDCLKKREQISMEIFEILLDSCGFSPKNPEFIKSVVDIFYDYNNGDLRFDMLNLLCEKNKLTSSVIEFYYKNQLQNAEQQRTFFIVLSHIGNYHGRVAFNYLCLGKISRFSTDSLGLLKLFLTAGFDVNNKDCSGNNTLHYLFNNDLISTELMQLLLDKKVEVNHKNGNNETGSTPIEHLVCKKDIPFKTFKELINQLAKHGGDFLLNKPYEDTPLAKILNKCEENNDFTVAKSLLWKTSSKYIRRISKEHIQKIYSAPPADFKEDYAFLPKKTKDKIFTYYCCMWEINKKSFKEKKYVCIPKILQNSICNRFVADELEKNAEDTRSSFLSKLFRN